MEKRILFGVLIFVLLAGSASSKEWTVCKSGCYSSKIQTAINAASPGDTITIGDGTFSESVVVDKSLIIRSRNGPKKTTISSTSYSKPTIEVTADDVEITGVSIRDEYISIGLHDLYNCNIHGNDISGTGKGVILSSVSSCTISENNISETEEGIGMYHSSNNIVSDNRVDEGMFGIYLTDESTSNTISNNRLNSGGIITDGVLGNQVSGNTLNGRPITYLEGASDQTVPDSAQVILMKCRNMRVIGQDISKSLVGILLYWTNQSTISGNSVTNNSWMGILLMNGSNGNTINGNNVMYNNMAGVAAGYGSNGNVIEDNTVLSNEVVGIDIEGCDDNQVTGNTLSGNGVGIAVAESKGPKVRYNSVTSATYGLFFIDVSLGEVSHNNVTNSIIGSAMSSFNQGSFFGNRLSNNGIGIGVEDSTGSVFYDNLFNSTNNTGVSNSTCDWNIAKTPGTNIIGGPFIGGNYWSDYNGYGTESDGFGSNPYVVGKDNTDLLPLVLEGTVCPQKGDRPPCGEITLSEVVAVINQWAQGKATLSEVIALINSWAS